MGPTPAGCGDFAAQGSADFQPDDFDYLITGECNHGITGTYQRVLG